MTRRMYGFWRSIASFRVRAALNLKNLGYEEVSVDILQGEQFDSSFEQLNTAHAVPALVEEDGFTLTQSLAIMEYLDEVYPEPPLMPDTARERAYARTLALVTVADTHPLMVPRVRKHLAQEFGADEETVTRWVRHWIGEGMGDYERMLKQRPPQPFALGNSPGIADICIAGHAMSAELFSLDLSPYPSFKALSEHCFSIPAFRNAHARNLA
ncbi:maleylacetoacetate isomerase [Aureimonas fodinaquatilis]|uniref:Maleylacetoacetate isomerase n=1 Tax=Aureimonas fodinaquatilis TaxID=2565783 RepID=A0A5B0E1P7_9HYPH|nr:maleylacetoacetate isomerase [Aureimonas fodinaquatilis]KAA0971891.1 maleylacetoacetate isomerase [Aureimonas fodinaquatilis]